MASEIIEAMPRAPYRVTANGPVAMRNFWVIGASAADVLDQLKTGKNVYRGAIYRDLHDNIPDNGLRCDDLALTQLTPTPTDGAGLWFVDAVYIYPAIRWFKAPRTIENGVLMWVESREITKPAELTAAGRRITNAADEFPNPLPMVPDVEETLVMTWMRQAASQVELQLAKRQYHNKINSTEYAGAPPHCLRCRPLVYDELPTPSDIPLASKLFRITAYLEFRDEVTVGSGKDEVTAGGWDLLFPNVGTRVKDAGPKKYKRLMEPDEDGGALVPVRQPVPLNTAGTARLADGNPLNYRKYDDMLREIDFAGLAP